MYENEDGTSKKQIPSACRQKIPIGITMGKNKFTQFLISLSGLPLSDINEVEDPEEISHVLWQEACWVVINAYFDEKGLVRQQLDSFDEFIQMSVQRIVEDSPAIELQAEAQHTSGEIENPVRRMLFDFPDYFLINRLFAAPLPVEVRPNLPLEADALGEGRLP